VPGAGPGRAAPGRGGAGPLRRRRGGLAGLGPGLAGGTGPAMPGPMRTWAEQQLGDMHGQVPVDSPSWLLIASPHSGTTFEAVGAVGSSLLVLTFCLVAAERARAVMYPLAAAGAMALTVYAGHILVMASEGMSHLDTAPFRWEAFVGT